MNVFVQPTGRRIDPFGDSPGEVLILNRPLSAWQRDALVGAGLTPIDRPQPPCLIIPDALFTTSGALRAFVDGAAGRDAVLVLKQSVYGKNSVPVQPGVTPCDLGWRFEEIRFVSGRGDPAVDVVVDPDEQVVKMPLPTHYVGSGEIEIPFPRHPLMTIHHWVHILWANQVAGSIELRATPKWKFILTGLWALLRARSFNRWRLLGKANTIGKNCDIHPTAIIEGSTLGDGVSVGPYARVLFSRLGDKVGVMAGAMVEACTLGDRSMVSQQTVVRFCVLYPEAIASQYLMQQCVLGRRAVTTGGAFSMDLNFDGPIRVPLDGKLHSTGTQFLGSAFGHGARIGTGHWLASGRAVPNETFLIRDPRQVIARISPDLAGQGPLINDQGTLRPLAAGPDPETTAWVRRVLGTPSGGPHGEG